MKTLILLFTLFVLVGCGSTPVNLTGDFNAALMLLEEGKTDLARSRFALACLRSSAAACDLIGQVTKIPVERLAIIQGATNDTTTQIAILERKGSANRHFLWKRGTLELIKPVEEKVIERGSSDWHIRRLRYDKLNKADQYSLHVMAPNGILVDLRRLRSLDTSRRQAEIVAAACMDDTYKEQQEMWREVAQVNPDILIFMGDNVYADRKGIIPAPATPDSFWDRYVETRNMLEIFRAEQLIPVFAIWDDHDFGVNDGDKNYPHKAASLETFRAFFPMEPIDGFLENGPGASSVFEAFGQRFVLLDDRTFRTPKLDPNLESKKQEVGTHFGEEQEKWALDILHKTTVPTWLVSGDQWFGAYSGFESYEGTHSASFKEFLKLVKKAPSPVVFLSGDRHLGEIMQINSRELGYRTYELTSSAIHAKTYPDTWKKNKNPRQIGGVAGKMNYLHLDTKAERKAIDFTATIFGPEKKALVTKRLRVAR